MKNFGWTLAGMLAAASAVAQSPAGWPQWGGPTRDFKVPAGRLAPWPASGPREIWSRALGEGYSAIAADGSTLFTQYRIGDHVYASSGDFGPAVFTAVNVRTGDIAWQTRDVARASAVYGDGQLVILDEEGTLYLATVTPQALRVRAKAQVLSGRSWTVPTLVGTRVYLRDRTSIKALELG